MNAIAPVRSIPLWIPALAAFMALVAAANVALVWLSGSGHRDLVRPDYYEAGLAQDSVIARAEGSAAWSKGVSLHPEDGGWILEAPQAPAGATGGNVRLYRPDDGRADREARLEKAGDGRWTAAFPGLRRGRWIATVAWDEAGRILGEGSITLDAKD